MEKVRFTLSHDAENQREIAGMLEKLYQNAGDVTIVAAGPDGLQEVIERCKSKGEEAPMEQSDEYSETGEVFELSVLTHGEAISKQMAAMTRYYVLKPVAYDELMRYISTQTQPRKESKRKVDVTRSAASLCLRIGMPPHILGYQYICHAVALVVEEPEIINRITKELYPRVADHFTTTASKVERSIRHSITVVWKRGRIDEINETLGFPVYTEQSKPTNGEFIALLSNACKPDEE